MWEPELKENRSKYAQINEHTKLDTVHEGIKAKPPGGSLQKSARSRNAGGDLQALSSYEKKDIDQKIQVKYMFELQTVKHEWYSNVENKMVAADAGKIAEAVTAALAGQASGASSNSKTANRKTTLFIIDPQVDFHPGGSLAIDAAAADSKRIAEMIDTFGEDHIHDIFVSMDSHYPCHIAHAVSWHAKGDPKAHPPAYTKITNADVKNGVWVYADTRPEMQEWALAYTGALERRGRMTLTIWPEHCIIGSKGHSVVPLINTALQKWAHKAGRPINYIMKGQNLRVEMYSALQAEVPDPKDQNTGLNVELLSMLKTSDRV
jgi:nicotinamidase-related amidase